MEHLLNLILGPVRQSGLPSVVRDAEDAIGHDDSAWLDAIAPELDGPDLDGPDLDRAGLDRVEARGADADAADHAIREDMAEGQWIAVGSVIERAVWAWTGITASVEIPADGSFLQPEAAAKALLPISTALAVASEPAALAEEDPAVSVDGDDITHKAVKLETSPVPAEVRASEPGAKGVVPEPFGGTAPGTELFDDGAAASGRALAVQSRSADNVVDEMVATGSARTEQVKQSTEARAMIDSLALPHRTATDDKGEAAGVAPAPLAERVAAEAIASTLTAREGVDRRDARGPDLAPRDRDTATSEGRTPQSTVPQDASTAALDGFTRRLFDPAATPGSAPDDVIANGFSARVEVAAAALTQASDPAAPAAHGRPAEVAAQAIARQISDVAPRSRHGEIEIALSPEELGRVRLVISGGERGAIVTVFFDRADVLDLMRRHPEQLMQDLRDSGFADARLDLRDGSSGQRQRSDEPPSRADGSSPDLGEPLAAAARIADPNRQAAPAAAGDRHLDIRL